MKYSSTHSVLKSQKKSHAKLLSTIYIFLIFVDLESLELLSLAGNILRQVPTTALYPLHSLVILYLNNNRIERIDQHDFPAKIGHNLTNLWLQNNM